MYFDLCVIFSPATNKTFVILAIGTTRCTLPRTDIWVLQLQMTLKELPMFDSNTWQKVQSWKGTDILKSYISKPEFYIHEEIRTKLQKVRDDFFEVSRFNYIPGLKLELDTHKPGTREKSDNASMENLNNVVYAIYIYRIYDNKLLL